MILLALYLYLVRKKEVNFILSYYTNLSHTGQEKFTSFFRTRYTSGLTVLDFNYGRAYAEWNLHFFVQKPVLVYMQSLIILKWQTNDYNAFCVFLNMISLNMSKNSYGGSIEMSVCNIIQVESHYTVLKYLG